MAEPPIAISAWRDWEALPAPARTLAGADPFSTEAWYRSVSRAAMAPGHQPSFEVVSCGSDVLAVFPMQHGPDGLSALTTPYTVLWSPLLRRDLGHDEFWSMGRALGRAWRRFPLTRLDAMDAGAGWLSPFMAGLRRSGLLPLRFDHFGNWHQDVSGLGWAGYLAGRPGPLRSAIARRTRRLMEREGATFSVIGGTDGLEQGLAAYEKVYAASWKQPEPYPAFNPALMRACAAEGSLRLGMLELDGVPLATQFWLVHGGWAGVQKLAHDERQRQLAPGTVLTGLMVRHLIEQEQVSELDFGRGDDPYKSSWAGERRQRVGVVLATIWRFAGAVQCARHWASQQRRAFRARSMPGPSQDVERVNCVGSEQQAEA